MKKTIIVLSMFFLSFVYCAEENGNSIDKKRRVSFADEGRGDSLESIAISDTKDDTKSNGGWLNFATYREKHPFCFFSCCQRRPIEKIGIISLMVKYDDSVQDTLSQAKDIGPEYGNLKAFSMQRSSFKKHEKATVLDDSTKMKGLMDSKLCIIFKDDY